MWKSIVAGTAALAIAGTSLVYAQQHQHGGRADDGSRWRPSAEDMRAFGEARLAALRAGLTLRPDQEQNWPAFEQAARELGKVRRDQMEAMRNRGPGADPAERLRQRGTAMSDMGAAMKKLADATEPLYKSLDDSQKRRFDMLNRFNALSPDPLRGYAGPRGHGHDGPRWRGHDGPRGHGGMRRTDAPEFEMEHPGGERL